MKELLEVGKVVSTHGIKGEIRIQHWCDSPDIFLELDSLYLDNKGEKSVEIMNSRCHKNVIIASLEGVNTIEEAQRLKGQIFYVPRDTFSLEKDTYFITDLIGIKVLHQESLVCYGKIVEITSAGGNEVYHIKGEGEKIYLIPAIASVVKEVNLEEGEMKIIPLKGLFDED